MILNDMAWVRRFWLTRLSKVRYSIQMRDERWKDGEKKQFCVSCYVNEELSLIWYGCTFKIQMKNSRVCKKKRWKKGGNQEKSKVIETIEVAFWIDVRIKIHMFEKKVNPWKYDYKQFTEPSGPGQETCTQFSNFIALYYNLIWICQVNYHDFFFHFIVFTLVSKAKWESSLGKRKLVMNII